MKFYVFGDSIAFGQHVSLHKTWASQLSNYLSTLDQRYTLQLTAFNGETSSQALERFDYCVKSHNPTFVWLQYGLNDANYWISDEGRPRTEPNKFLENISFIIKSLLDSGTKKVFVGTNHIVTKEIEDGVEKGQYSKNAQFYNELIRMAVAQFPNGAQIIDIEKHFFEKFSSPEEYLLQDQIHLNEAGHLAFASFGIEMIEKDVNCYAGS
jgi:lysophospholipase L1-like esterase